MKKLSLLLISLGLCFTSGIQATNLTHAYSAAQQSDPTYQGAEAAYKAQHATLGEARGALLPNLGLTGSWMHANTDVNTQANFNDPGSPAGNTNVTTPANTLAYTLTLSQPLFNWEAFAAYDQIKATVKEAAATYAAATQDLISRVASAYFAVLQSQEVLRYTDAQKQALARQLDVAKQRYDVGLDPVTSVYDAQAQYDSTVAMYIANENDLANKKEALREITGSLYPNLARLKDDFPLLQPEPANIDQWTQLAEQQNTSLLAQRYAAEAAEKNVKVKSAQHLPTLSLDGTYSSSDKTLTNVHASQTVSGPAYGVGLTLPIYSGGSVDAQTEQAQYQYQGAIALLEFTHRQVMANTRIAYLSVLAEISQIEADRQAIKSATAALASNEAGYKVGTQTIVDVLNAQTALYLAQTNYAKDRYAYVLNTLALKEAAGTLNANDVIQINAWLTDAPWTVPAQAKTPVATHAKKVTHHAVKKPAVHKHVTHKQPVKKPVVKKVAPVAATDETSADLNQ